MPDKIKCTKASVIVWFELVLRLLYSGKLEIVTFEHKNQLGAAHPTVCGLEFTKTPVAYFICSLMAVWGHVRVRVAKNSQYRRHLRRTLRLLFCPPTEGWTLLFMQNVCGFERWFPLLAIIGLQSKLWIPALTLARWLEA